VSRKEEEDGGLGGERERERDGLRAREVGKGRSPEPGRWSDDGEEGLAQLLFIFKGGNFGISTLFFGLGGVPVALVGLKN